MAESALEKRLEAHRFGITEVYNCENPLADVVFVHGLNGHPYNTWATKDKNFFWPAELLPLKPRSQAIRVLMFGYNATVTAFMDGTSKDKLHHHAEQLAAELSADRYLNGALERPIIFVAHSLGGLVVKKTLTYCSQETHEKLRHLRSIFTSTYGVLFMGTPHNGSEFADWGSMLQSIFHVMSPKKIFDSTSELLNVLKKDNEHLQNINRDFAQIMKSFRIYFFHESKPMDLKATRAFVVDEQSAAPSLEGVERMGIAADHSSMCRFGDEHAPGYTAVAEAILRYTEDAVKVIPSRWEVDRTHERAEREYEMKRLSDMIQGSELSVRTPNTVSQRNSSSSLPPNQMAQLEQPSGATTDGEHNPSHDEAGQLQKPREPLSVLPSGFHPNSAFYGMRDELHKLHNRLSDAERRSQGSVAVLLYAGPGSGKSYLARQYLYEYQSLYPGGIFWVDAKTPQSRAAAYWQIANAIYEFQSPGPGWFSHNMYVEKVRLWLEDREDWLLVFDGITFEGDDELTEFKNYLPFRKSTSILYTSVDRTLSQKARLFEPEGIEVQPLSVSDARKLLFRGLGISSPTLTQRRKATDLAKYYECLPLAMHAIGHRLNASGKSLELYKSDSHLTDQRLAGPYRGIMEDLKLKGRDEALNLINILSFFGHDVPVGMILYGRRALMEINVEIRANEMDRVGSTDRHIDHTLAVLIKYGLIERTLDSYIMSDQSSGSSIERRSHSIHSRSSPEDSEESSSLRNLALVGPGRNSIDIVKVHTVVQGFCRDELKAHNREDFYRWLGVATALFCRSYVEATARIKATRGPGHVRDYREYLTHARRLVGHFPATLRRSTVDLTSAHKYLGRLIDDMEAEIETRSPSSSEVSVRHQKSIFDSATSFSSDPSTPASGSTGPHLEHVSSESPDDISFPDHPKLISGPPAIQIPHPPVRQGYEDDVPVSTGHSPSMSLDTEMPPTPKPEKDEDEGWEVVKKKAMPFWKVWGDRFREGRSRNRKDLGTFRHAAAAPIVSDVQGTGSSTGKGHVPQNSSLHSQSPAESMLAGLRHSSPPPSRGALRAASRSRLPGDGHSTYASAARSGQKEEQRRQTLSFRHGVPTPSTSPMPEPSLFQSNIENKPLSDATMESRIDRMSESTHSDPGLVQMENQAPASGGPRILYSHAHLSDGFNTDAPSTGDPTSANTSQLPYDSHVTLTRRRPANTSSNSGYASTQPGHQQHLTSPPLPNYYGSLPISRDPSGQSTQSLHTEPSRMPPKFSPDPRASVWPPMSSSLTNVSYNSPRPGTSPGQRLRFGPPEWGADSGRDTPGSDDGAPAMSRNSSGPGMIVGGGNVIEFGHIPSNGNIRFGEQDPISVDEARERTEQYEHRIASQYYQYGRQHGMPPYPTQPPYPNQNMMPTSSDSGRLEALMNQSTANGTGRRPLGSRRRSGSSPARHDFHGLGLYNRGY